MNRVRCIAFALVFAVIFALAGCGTGKTPQNDVKTPETEERWDDGQDYPEPGESFKEQIRDILAKYGTSIDGIYNFINNEDPEYMIYYDDNDKTDDIPPYNELAEYIMTRGHGVCYHYASLTYYLLKEAGYEALIIHGYRNSDNALHYWTMVKVNGKWYHFDPLHHQKLLTDSEKHGEIKTRGNGLTWEQGIWPTTN